ncbi:uncharacterized protein FIBRA_06701 [Fibroporia radiculosa]|uniref:Uncharacterized protein n=1 Tax=Fibroporia radiculosa TaxID=599839 RepID=J4GTA4_9APHY|nr:uncharacterized protein FIBRA_06701 [Fibroporia radiculosa]CCM04520.1 predicted protein [Fibroporia radiculosa]
MDWVSMEATEPDIDADGGVPLDTKVTSYSESRPPSAPIERIPQDVLSLIFITTSASIWNLRERKLFSLRVASVSRSWRDLALDISSLWSTIYISLNFRPTPASIQLFLYLSRTHKLDIVIDWANADIGSRKASDSRYIFCAMDALIPHISRWKSMSIAWDISTCKGLEDTFVPLFVGNASSLEHLQVFCFDYLFQPRRLNFFRKQFAAPHLSTLVLRAMPGGFSLNSIAECFPGLEEFIWDQGVGFEHINRWDAAGTFLKYLMPLVRLRLFCIVNLYIHDPRPERYMSSHLQTLLPALERLEIIGSKYEAVEDILAALTAPKLAEVLISNPELPFRSPFNGFWQQSTRFPVLRTLRLAASCDAPDPEDIWEAFSGMHCVQMTSSDYDDLVNLLRSWQEDWHFPKLTSLEFYCSPSLPIPVAMLRTFVSTRREVLAEHPNAGLGTILSIRVYTSATIADDDIKFFVDNVQDFRWTPELPQWDPGCSGVQGDYIAIRWVNSG